MAKSSFMVAFMIWFLVSTSIQEFQISEASERVDHIRCRWEGECSYLNYCDPNSKQKDCKKYCEAGICKCTCGGCCFPN
ncbi:unnamed protein product [Lupinus luteus]|uniref:Uncharacterized protein n=1 Tax=Lupinus luteus TaxID=3873 RepID=A0AAV1VZC5_LUPLU